MRRYAQYLRFFVLFLSGLDLHDLGLSELPLEQCLLLLLAGDGLVPFLVLCACEYSKHGNAAERGPNVVVGERWRVEGGLEGARSLFWWLFWRGVFG